MTSTGPNSARNEGADIITTRFEGPAPEVAISTDMIKRGLLVAPILIAVCGVIWGVNGAWSSAYGIAIVLVNFALAAAFIAAAARISIGLMMGATLFGYLIRLALIFIAVWLVKDASWISLPALGSTIIVTHLGLLFWEMKYVALSLAYPGLKPSGSQPAT
ncbi:MAG: ATP synthase subunit I [Actinobacteria bacterium]|nr:MAG: ATP synthase subunit I [Actinomycetota bacterium]